MITKKQFEEMKSNLIKGTLSNELYVFLKVNRNYAFTMGDILKKQPSLKINRKYPTQSINRALINLYNKGLIYHKGSYWGYNPESDIREELKEMEEEYGE